METRVNKYVVMPWHWKSLPMPNNAKLSYGKLYRRISSSIVELDEKPVSCSLLTIKKQQEEIVARLEQSSFLYYGYIRNRDRLYSMYDLSHDGEIDASILTFCDTYLSISSDFSDYVVSGNRFIEKMTDWIKSVFEKGSNQVIGWRSLTKSIFDSNIAYALFDQYRNEIEHGFSPISVVNFDESAHKVGAALNLEAGILEQHSIKKIVKKRLEGFREERIKDGETPWLSVASLTFAYDVAVCTLFLTYIAMLADEFRKRNNIYKNNRISRVNCIYWHVENDEAFPQYSVDRVYPISDDNYLTGIKRRAREIGKYLKDLEPENEAACLRIDSLIQRILKT